MSPLPFGILAASGGSLNSIEYLGSVSGNGSTVDLTFSGIPNTYQHLYLMGLYKIGFNSSGWIYDTGVRFNGLSNSHYSTQRRGEGSWGTLSNGNQNQIQMLGMPGNASATALDRGVLEMMVVDYAYNDPKFVWGRAGGWNDTSRKIYVSSGAVNTNSAISSLTIVGNIDWPWLSSTKFWLYGVK